MTVPMPDILDAIDAATEERCACGCGTRLDPDGPSGWWATEHCQATWAAKRVGVEPDQPPWHWVDVEPESGEGWGMADVGNAWTSHGGTLRDLPTSPVFGIPVVTSPWLPEDMVVVFDPTLVFRDPSTPTARLRSIVVARGLAATKTPEQPPRWRRALRRLTPKIKVSGQWVRGRTSPIDYGNRGGDLVIEWFGRWLRFAVYVGSPPGSHIGFWRTCVGTMRGINLRVGRRYIGPCVTVFVHTRPSRREQ
jgi:hypothetical protein